MHKLKPYNTFGLDIKAQELVVVDSKKALLSLLPLPDSHLILGGGSNILFTRDFEGVVLHNQIKGQAIVFEDQTSVHLKVGGGVVWHTFVLSCIEKGWSGVENLSLIPGTVGAAPIQNIGAYGVELKDVFIRLEAVHLQTGKVEVFDSEACRFGYRDSIFKQALRKQYFITSVTFELTKKHILNTGYGAIQNYLETHDLQPSIRTVSEAVSAIRQSKLPDPKEIGNAGSFFKNPIIPREQYVVLQAKFPEMPCYEVSVTEVKVPAGWLIDQLGWKGFEEKNIGVHKKQALVLVNYGTGCGADIVDLAERIIADVLSTYNIQITAEVNII